MLIFYFNSEHYHSYFALYKHLEFSVPSLLHISVILYMAIGTIIKLNKVSAVFIDRVWGFLVVNMAFTAFLHLSNPCSRKWFLVGVIVISKNVNLFTEI